MELQLRRIGLPDLPIIQSWVRSPEAMVQWSGPWNFTFPLDEDQLARFFLTEALDGGLRRMQFVATEGESQVPVGQIGFGRIWSRTDAAHLGPVIVDPALRGRGIGSRMVREALKFGFDQLRLHRIELVVFDFNSAAIACYERAGFRTEGVLRDIVRVGGVYWHWRAMSILEDEWSASAPGSEGVT
jgi:RimJ/RimL family protein N-acetyltransferase